MDTGNPGSIFSVHKRSQSPMDSISEKSPECVWLSPFLLWPPSFQFYHLLFWAGTCHSSYSFTSQMGPLIWRCFPLWLSLQRNWEWVTVVCTNILIDTFKTLKFGYMHYLWSWYSYHSSLLPQFQMKNLNLREVKEQVQVCHLVELGLKPVCLQSQLLNHSMIFAKSA
jgi:hypothetical protein